MADNIVWSPRTGSTGDNQYKWGTASKATRGVVGGTSPSLSDVNSYTGFNQIIAELKRRGQTISYVTDGTQKIGKTFLTNLQTKINAVRTGLGISSYSFTSITDGSLKVKNTVLLELRKALTTSVVSGGAVGTTREILLVDIPYGTTGSVQNPSTTYRGHIGKGSRSGGMNRWRQIVQVSVSANTETYSINLLFPDGTSQNLEDIGSLSAYLVTSISDYNNFGTLLGSQSIASSGVTTLSISLNPALLSVGTNYILLVTAHDAATDGSSGPGSAGFNSMLGTDISVTNTLSFTVD